VLRANWREQYVFPPSFRGLGLACLREGGTADRKEQRKIEAIREARRREDEKREEQRREKFDETKDKVRRKRKSSKPEPSAFAEEPLGKDGKPKKKVGFA